MHAAWVRGSLFQRLYTLALRWLGFGFVFAFAFAFFAFAFALASAIR
ncbi:hypothetical protein K788_0004358 (plasmid) [Paraburkholderia caribensis MBA4]|uniref:Uncharacterized protein n=1 Tax=Paraburkholderia caribensis MBA4 TaxID=1323664 RepID=A0A0P0RP06_9BURK|nr:hypothetical protein K788_0004358 [Paraburkholderia caribensis MBA4]